MKIAKDFVGVGVGAFILNENNELLLLKKAVSPEKDCWRIPGGKLELYQTMKDSLIKEVKKECGIDISVLKLMGVCEHMVLAEGGHWVATSFLCEIKKGIPEIMDSKKISDMQWFALDNLPKELTITTQKAIEDYQKI